MHIEKLYGSQPIYHILKNTFFKKLVSFYLLSIGNVIRVGTRNLFPKVSTQKFKINSNVSKSHKHGRSNLLFIEWNVN